MHITSQIISILKARADCLHLDIFLKLHRLRDFEEKLKLSANNQYRILQVIQQFHRVEGP